MACSKMLRMTMLLTTTLIGSISFALAMDESVAEEIRCASFLRQQAIETLKAQLLKQQQEQELSNLKEKIAAQAKPFKNKYKRPHK
jgi:hypothetical protein